MEPAGAIVGIICAVGQAAQTASKLYHFFKSVRGAPAHITSLSERLLKLNILLLRLNDTILSVNESRKDAKWDLIPNLDGCYKVLEELEGFVERHRRKGKEGEEKMNVWSRMKWVFREDELRGIGTALEEELRMLSISFQALNISIDMQTRASVDSLRTTMERALDFKQQDLKPISYKIETIDSKLKTLEQSLSVISGHLQKTDTAVLSDDLTMIIQKAVAASVQQAIAQAMLGPAEARETCSFQIPPSYVESEPEFSPDFIDPNALEESTGRITECYPENMSAGSGSRYSTTYSLATRFRKHKRIETSFGTLLIYSSSEDSHLEKTPLSLHLPQNQTKFELGFTFIPAKWLLSTAFSASFAKRTQFGFSDPKVEMGFRTFTVIPCAAKVMEYARDGNIQGIRELFRRGDARPNDQDEYGRTPLHWAAGMGQLELCQYLLSVGADPTITNEFARTPLHWTSLLSCNPAVIRLLISHGSDPEASTVGGQTPLFHRTLSSSKSREIIDAFTKQDHFPVDIDHVDNWGRTPLMWELLSEEVENTGSIKELLEKGASVEKMDKDGYTPLHLLMLSCSPKLKKFESVVTLLKAGADPAAKCLTSGLTVTDIARCNDVFDMWEGALAHCGIAMAAVAVESKMDSRAVASAVDSARFGLRNRAIPEAGGMKRRRAPESSGSVDSTREEELPESKRQAIDQIPRRTMYRLFETVDVPVNGDACSWDIPGPIKDPNKTENSLLHSANTQFRAHTCSNDKSSYSSPTPPPGQSAQFFMMQQPSPYGSFSDSTNAGPPQLTDHIYEIRAQQALPTNYSPSQQYIQSQAPYRSGHPPNPSTQRTTPYIAQVQAQMAMSVPADAIHRTRVLQEYQAQLMILEQQNQHRMYQARSEQDNSGFQSMMDFSPTPIPNTQTMMEDQQYLEMLTQRNVQLNTVQMAAQQASQTLDPHQQGLRQASGFIFPNTAPIHPKPTPPKPTGRTRQAPRPYCKPTGRSLQTARVYSKQPRTTTKSHSIVQQRQMLEHNARPLPQPSMCQAQTRTPYQPTPLDAYQKSQYTTPYQSTPSLDTSQSQRAYAAYMQQQQQQRAYFQMRNQQAVYTCQLRKGNMKTGEGAVSQAGMAADLKANSKLTQ